MSETERVSAIERQRIEFKFGPNWRDAIVVFSKGKELHIEGHYSIKIKPRGGNYIVIELDE